MAMVHLDNILTWANANVGFVQLIYTFVTFILVGTVLYSNWQQGKLSKKVRKPNIYADLLEKGGVMAILDIVNDGLICAYDVKIINEDNKEGELLLELPSLPPKKRCNIEIGSINSISEKNEGKVKIKLTFRNEWNEKFESLQTLSTEWVGEVIDESH